MQPQFPKVYACYVQAGLLAFPFLIRLPIPLVLRTVALMNQNKDCCQSGITVAGTAPDFHGIPFSSSFQMNPNTYLFVR